ncbi:tail assembly protein [Salmonella enterica]|nr:tail assembly protein [Salmonella enterica]EKP6365031.1 tail assembly protein [Salmonella enterica subsp. diarizonae]
MGKTDALNLEMPGMARFCLHGDLKRFGRRFDICIKTAAEGLHALCLQIPGLRQKIQEGWYQVRIAGKDVTPDDVTARLHEPLPSGAVIHIVPRMEGAGNPVPIPYGEIMCGSRVISQEITTRDESTPDKVINLGGMPFFSRKARERAQDKLEQQLIDQGLPITKPRVLIR